MCKYRIQERKWLHTKGFTSKQYAIQMLKKGLFRYKWVNVTNYVFDTVEDAENILPYILDGYEMGYNYSTAKTIWE